MKEDKKRLVLIDTFALAHRSFHALPLMYSPTHEPVNAVYGLASTLIRVLREFEPAYLVAATDLPSKTFRHEQYKEYKAHRKEAPVELIDQIPKIYQLFEALDVPVYSKEGYEADDVIGAIANKVCEKTKDQRPKTSGIEVIIVTGDNDTLQLVNDSVKVYTMKRSISDTILYGPEEVKEKYGFGPELLVDYKALRGDPSDNIPGVRGIGEKTAQELIVKFGAIEEIYKNLEKLEIKPRTKELLATYKDDAFLSKELSTIQTGLDVDFDLKDAEYHPNKEKLLKLFQELGFRSLIERLDNVGQNKNIGLSRQSRGSSAEPGLRTQSEIGPRNDIIQSELFGAQIEKPKIYEPKDSQYILVDDQKKMKELIEELEKSSEFAVDTETNKLGSMDSDLVGISISVAEGKAFYIPVENKKDEVRSKKGLKVEEIKKELEAIFQNGKLKVGQNLKYDMQVLERHGLKLAGPYFDTMVASYILNPGTRGHSLDNLAFTLLGHQMIPITDLIGSGKDQISMAEVPVEKVAVYSAEDADFTMRIKKVLEQKFTPEIAKVFYEIEMPLLPILSDMQIAGIKIDRQFLSQMSHELGKRLGELEKNIYQLAGIEFNINSPQQLSDVLFNKLKLSSAGIRKTTLGRSTAADYLEKLKGSHKIIEALLEYRELFKLKSTYVDAIPELADNESRVHTSFNQTVTTTGRLSSSEPNLQNIPIRTEVGREIRKAFVAEKGSKLLAADYSQIELRVVAHLAHEKNMINAFHADGDIHAATAKLVFSKEEITPAERRVAKTINFGVLYGMSPYGLAKTLGISDDEAKQFIQNYFAQFPGIQIYTEAVMMQARNQGFVETMFGRRRYLPEIHASMPNVRMSAERMAINMPVQGTAADIMKRAMIILEKRLKEEKLSSKILLQVHDELVLEVPDNEIPRVSKLVKDIMENAVKISVPLIVDIKVGSNWGSLK